MVVVPSVEDSFVLSIVEEVVASVLSLDDSVVSADVAVDVVSVVVDEVVVSSA